MANTLSYCWHPPEALGPLATMGRRGGIKKSSGDRKMIMMIVIMIRMTMTAITYTKMFHRVGWKGRMWQLHRLWAILRPPRRPGEQRREHRGERRPGGSIGPGYRFPRNTTGFQRGYVLSSLHAVTHYIDIHNHICVCMCVIKYIYIYTYTDKYIHIRICVYTYIYIYIHIYIYIYMYTYVEIERERGREREREGEREREREREKTNTS